MTVLIRCRQCGTVLMLAAPDRKTLLVCPACHHVRIVIKCLLTTPTKASKMAVTT